MQDCANHNSKFNPKLQRILPHLTSYTLSPHTPRFNPTPVNVRFVVYRGALGLFSKYYDFLLSLSFQKCSN